MGMRPLVPFLALCLLISAARLASQHLIDRTGQSTILEMRVSLGEKILSTPLRQLEEVGVARLLTVLANDVNSVSNAVMVAPIICINSALVVGGLVHLATLSTTLFWIDPGARARPAGASGEGARRRERGRGGPGRSLAGAAVGDADDHGVVEVLGASSIRAASRRELRRRCGPSGTPSPLSSSPIPRTTAAASPKTCWSSWMFQPRSGTSSGAPRPSCWTRAWPRSKARPRGWRSRWKRRMRWRGGRWSGSSRAGTCPRSGSWKAGTSDRIEESPREGFAKRNGSCYRP